MNQPLTAEQILDGIRKGQVARQVRLFAAQGLLPVAREDLLRMQILLTADPDEEVARLASETLAGEDEEVLLDLVRTGELSALELDLLARIRRDQKLWMAIAARPESSDETLRILARYGDPLVQDVIMTNQVRILACLDLLEDLRSNPAVTQVILRRVKEFEEEFIEKAVAAETRGEPLETPEPGPSIEDALEALRAIGARLPAEEELVPPGDVDEELARQAEEAGKSIYAQLLILTTHEKIMRALKGSREERAILINSRNRLVARAVLGSPKLSEIEIERFASSRSVSDEVIRTIAANPRWLRRYPVVLALAGNPKTPVRVALNLLPRLNHRDLKRISKDRNVAGPVRTMAGRLLARRR